MKNDKYKADLRLSKKMSTTEVDAHETQFGLLTRAQLKYLTPGGVGLIQFALRDMQYDRAALALTALNRQKSVRTQKHK